MQIKRTLSIVVIILLLPACSSYYFSYNGKKYRSADAALAGQQTYIEEVKSEITVLPNQYPGTVVVITPTISTWEALGITRTGSPKKILVDYIAKTNDENHAVFAQYLEAAGVFDRVESKLADFPHMEAKKLQENYAATIYLQIKSPTQMGWFMFTPSSTSPVQVNFDTLAAPGAPKVDSWIQSVISNLDIAE